MAGKKGIAASLPDPGPDRWWSITLAKNAASKPVIVTLMESQRPGRKALSSPIGHARTIATIKAVTEAADLVLVNVGDYANVIGEFKDGTTFGIT